MAGNFNALFTQSFSSSSSITVTHNLNRTYICARVIVGGVLRNDLITSVTPSDSDPTNEFVVTLSSSQSGIVQVISSDVVPVETPTPTQAADLSGSGPEAGFSAFSTASTSITSSVSFTDLPLNTQRFSPNSAFYTHTPPSASVTIVQAGRYLVSFHISIDVIVNTRSVSLNRLSLNTGAGFNPLNGTDVYGYHRQTSQGENTVGMTGIFDFTAGSIIKAQSRIFAGGNQAFIANGSGITIQRLG